MNELQTQTSQVITRIDGIEQNIVIPEQEFTPRGVLEHEFLPLEYVIIKELNNDLMYMTGYFQVERLWRAFLDDHTFDRLLSKFLNGQLVVVNYGDEHSRKFDVFLPKTTKIPGFSVLYAEIVAELKSMDYNQLVAHLDDIGYDALYTMRGVIRGE